VFCVEKTTENYHDISDLEILLSYPDVVVITSLIYYYKPVNFFSYFLLYFLSFCIYKMTHWC